MGIVSGGGGGGAQPATFAIVRRSTSQSILDNNSVVVGWAAGIIASGGAAFTLDTDNGDGPTRLHVPADGIYTIGGIYTFDATKTAGYRSVAVSGGNFVGGGVGLPWPAEVNPDGYIWGENTWTELITAGDYCRAFAYVFGAGSAVNLIDAFMAVSRVG